MKKFKVWTVVPGGAISVPETIEAKYAFLAAEKFAKRYGCHQQGFVLNRCLLPTFIFPLGGGDQIKVMAEEITE